MKKLLGLAVAMSLFAAVPARGAGPDVPNLVGTWSTKSEGGILLKGEKPGAKTHWKAGMTSLEGEIVFAKQQGRVLTGTFKSKAASEEFIAVIGHDNRSLYYVDSDGFLDGKLVDADTIEIVYRHTTDKDIVIGVGALKRKK